MSRRLRHTLAGAVLAMTFAGAFPLLSSTAVQAAPTDSQVTFRGGGLSGLGLLACTSEPDASALTVTAETTVTFVNHTGQKAMLRVDGTNAGSVGASQAVPVTFHRGPVSVSMVPECGLNLNQNFGATRVEVTTAPDNQSPAPSRTSAAPAPTPQRSATRASASGRGSSAPTTSPATSVSSTPSESASAEPFGSADVPAAEELGDATRLTSRVAVAAPIPGPPAPPSANGLLALVATVCVAGVTAGAIRAILAQRASRTLAA